MRGVRVPLLALGCAWLAAAEAQEAEAPPAPDLEFLEYLGAWAEDDDEWLAIEEWQKDQAAEREGDRERAETEEEGDDEGE